jgi:hypothetical protein
MALLTAPEERYARKVSAFSDSMVPSFFHRSMPCLQEIDCNSVCSLNCAHDVLGCAFEVEEPVQFADDAPCDTRLRFFPLPNKQLALPAHFPELGKALGSQGRFQRFFVSVDISIKSSEIDVVKDRDVAASQA